MDAGIRWSHFPKSTAPPSMSREIVEVFENVGARIASPKNMMSSDEVLAIVRPGLLELGFKVESGKKKADKVQVPVLFGMNGMVEKSFDADAYHSEHGYVVEVEAGRAVVNNQFLKDLFQACVMHDAQYLATAVRNIYEGGNRRNRDFDTVVTFYDTLFSSNRLELPLEGVMVIGY
jgi:hypothetical protein